MPALAVVGADHRIIRSTETFRRQCDNAAALCDRSPEIDLVLKGQTDTAVANLGDVSVAVEAVTDAAGKRQAMLSLPADDLQPDAETSVVAIREAAGESPALVWVKDLDGCYVYVNLRFEHYLETSQERLCGSTDADLPAVETVDGPRLRYIEDGLQEPLALEYTVPAYESRPSMAAFRFPLRNEAGEPIGTCGVAAPINEADVARDEAGRLMQLERWNHLDPLEVRAELLEQWHVQATPGPAPASLEDGPDEPPAASDDERALPSGSAAAAVEAGAVRPDSGTFADGSAGSSYPREDEWVRQLRQAASINANDAHAETADALQCDLQLARKWAERADQLQGELQELHVRLREAEAQAQQAMAATSRAEEAAKDHRAELEQASEESALYKAQLAQATSDLARAAAELEQATGKLARERAEADTARSELETAQSELQTARRELEAAKRELGAARARSESLRGPSDAAARLSEELGRALTAERERGDELARVLARVRSRLGDFEGALDRSKPAKVGGAVAGGASRH